MAHPRMYRDDDPHLAAIRELCLGFPEASEVEAWGRPTFRAGKRMFAVYTSGAEGHPFTLEFKPDPSERSALLADGRFISPPYSGASGWLAVDLARSRDDRREPDWAELRELVDTSYRQVALKRMLGQLDRTTS